MESRPLSWSESMKITGINLKHKALAYVDQSPSTDILPNFQELTILGEKFSSNPNNHKLVNELIFKRFNNTCWITYRSQFKEMKNGKGESYVTDAGWGCMVRAGQMMIAQILKKHLKFTEKQELYEILELFDDMDEKALFSIQNIVEMAQKQHDLDVGEWYTPNQISYILKDLFDGVPTNPYNKSLSIKIFNNSCILFDQIIHEMTGKEQTCQCKKQLAVCYKCNKKNKAVNVIILTRIGLDSSQPEYLRILNKLIDCEYFQGFIGGKPGKALYILGRHSNRYIYLDPHMAQTAVSKSNFQKQRSTYFCNSYRSCKNKDIDPSMGVSFYLQDLQDIDKLYEYLKEIKSDYPDNFFLFMSLQTPDYMKPDYQIDQNAFFFIDEDITKEPPLQVNQRSQQQKSPVSSLPNQQKSKETKS